MRDRDGGRGDVRLFGDGGPGQQGVSMQSVLLTAFCATMARRLRQDRVLIALMAGNRVDPRMETWSARSTISSRCSSIGRSPPARTPLLPARELRCRRSVGSGPPPRDQRARRRVSAPSSASCRASRRRTSPAVAKAPTPGTSTFAQTDGDITEFSRGVPRHADGGNPSGGGVSS